MSCRATAISPTANVKNLTWTGEEMSLLYGLFETLGEVIEDEVGSGLMADFANKALIGDAAITNMWGAALAKALEAGRVYRSVCPIANDGSLAMGISECLGATHGENLYEDLGEGEQRFEVFENDQDSQHYPWLTATAEFLTSCGGFTGKGRW
jgi:hypothetical protein